MTDTTPPLPDLIATLRMCADWHDTNIEGAAFEAAHGTTVWDQISTVATGDGLAHTLRAAADRLAAEPQQRQCALELVEIELATVRRFVDHQEDPCEVGNNSGAAYWKELQSRVIRQIDRQLVEARKERDKVRAEPQKPAADLAELQRLRDENAKLREEVLAHITEWERIHNGLDAAQSETRLWRDRAEWLLREMQQGADRG